MQDFGESISLKGAEEMYLSALKIKCRTADKIKEVFIDDPEALRYYLGSEIAYIFSREFIVKMSSLIGTDNKKGVALYIGSKPDKILKVDGRPTLMAFAFDTLKENGRDKINLIDSKGQLIKKSDDAEHSFFVDDLTASGNTQPLFIGDSLIGFEHPGGGSVKEVIIEDRIAAGLPVSFFVDEIQPGIF